MFLRHHSTMIIFCLLWDLLVLQNTVKKILCLQVEWVELYESILFAKNQRLCFVEQLRQIFPDGYLQKNEAGFCTETVRYDFLHKVKVCNTLNPCNLTLYCIASCEWALSTLPWVGTPSLHYTCINLLQIFTIKTSYRSNSCKTQNVRLCTNSHV